MGTFLLGFIAGITFAIAALAATVTWLIYSDDDRPRNGTSYDDYEYDEGN